MVAVEHLKGNAEGKYSITANALAPAGMTRMVGTMPGMEGRPVPPEMNPDLNGAIVAYVAGVSGFFGMASLLLPSRAMKLGALVLVGFVLLGTVAWLAYQDRRRGGVVSRSRERGTDQPEQAPY